MKLSPDEITRIARLAHLRIDSRELDRVACEFASILSYFERLQQLDTSGIEPTSHSTAAHEPKPESYRADVATESLPQEEALREAPEQANGHFLVPKVIA